MKKIIISILFLSIFTISCESDNEIKPYVTPDYITGKWLFKKTGSINAQNVVLYEDYVHAATCEEDNLDLKNGNKTFSLNEYTVTGTNCVNSATTGNFSILNKDLTLTYIVNNNEVKTVFTVVSLTYDELVLSTTNDVNQVVFYKLSRALVLTAN